MRSRFIAASLVIHAAVIAAAGTLATSMRAPALAPAAVLQIRLAAPQPAPAPAAEAHVQSAAPAAKPERPAARTAAARRAAPKSDPAPPRPATAAASAPPPPAVNSGAASAEETDGPAPAERANHLRSVVLSLLAPSLTYPPLARKYGWQGRVLVDVELDADGSLQPLRIAHSSGYRILDHHAFDALKRLGTVPQARPWLGGRPFAFAVPVTYRLIDG